MVSTPNALRTSVVQGLFSAKSDVWAYGVLMWEVVTLGKLPYGAMGIHEIGKEVAVPLFFL